MTNERMWVRGRSHDADSGAARFARAVTAAVIACSVTMWTSHAYPQRVRVTNVRPVYPPRSAPTHEVVRVAEATDRTEINGPSLCGPYPAQQPAISESALASTPVCESWRPPEGGIVWKAPAAALSRTPEDYAVEQMALTHAKRGYSLAMRGAAFSARVEFVNALRVLAEARDLSEGSQAHSAALAAGFRALEEAEDFVPKTAQIDHDLKVLRIARTHETPVVNAVTLNSVATPTALRQRYYSYAQEQFTAALAGAPVGSAALYALGKLKTTRVASGQEDQAVAEPAAMVLFQSALTVDQRNYVAANELAVLLTRWGRPDTAKAYLLLAIEHGAGPDAWHNLAAVNHTLGDVQGAATARAQAERLASIADHAPQDGATAGEGLVEWMAPQRFAGTSTPVVAHVNTASTAPVRTHTATAPPSAESGGGIWSWLGWK